jgi:hypothetical protein
MVVALVSTVAVGGEFSGKLTSDLLIDLSNPAGFEMTNFQADLDLDYSLSDVTLGLVAIIDASELQYILFDAWGNAGPLWFTSYLQFGGPVNDIPMDFDLFATIAGVSIAGIDMYGVFAIDDRYTGLLDDPDPAVGWQYGVAGYAGDIGLMIEISSDMYIYYEQGYYYNHWGGYVLSGTIWPDSNYACSFYQLGDRFPFAWKNCDGWYVGYPIWVDQTGDETPCHAEFDRLNILITMPFTCLDLSANINFWCPEGDPDATVFDAWFLIENIDIGVPFLELEYIEVDFAPDRKWAYFDWGLLIADTICIQPVFEILYPDWNGMRGERYSFDGFQLLALTLEYTYNGVTFKTGTSFSEYGGFFDRYGNRYPWGYPEIACPTLWCESMNFYNEYFGLIIDGDSCCGGGFALSIFTWFDDGDIYTEDGADAAGIFDWEETRIEGYFDIGVNTALTGSLSVVNEGLNWMQFGVEVTF